VAGRYGMQLDMEADRFTIPNVSTLTATVRKELGR